MPSLPPPPPAGSPTMSTRTFYIHQDSRRGVAKATAAVVAHTAGAWLAVSPQVTTVSRCVAAGGWRLAPVSSGVSAAADADVVVVRGRQRRRDGEAETGAHRQGLA